MQTKSFTYSKGKQKNIALLFLMLAIMGAGVAFYMWLWADPLNLFVLVGGVFLSLLGIIVFLKLILAPNKEDKIAFTISDKGITAGTTPVAKAAGLIEWTDITHIQLYQHLLEIQVKDPEKYAARMKRFFIRDTFLKSLNGTIRISIKETNASYDEVKKLLQQHVSL